MIKRITSLILSLIMLVSAVPVQVFADDAVDSTVHEHVWDGGVVTPPNCDSVGCTTYTCGKCGESYTDSEIPALGHNWGEGVVTAPTCSAVGFTAYTCAVCGSTKQENEVAALGHNWGDWTVTQESTVEAEGQQERICAVCYEKETEAIAKLPQPEHIAVTSVEIIQLDENGNKMEEEIAELTVGETLSLTAAVLPGNATDKTVIWFSSDETMATVDTNGTVTAVAAGEVTVTAACGEATDTYTLTVKTVLQQEEQVAVTSIEITAESDCIAPGETLQLTAAVLPDNATNQNVIWSSEDESVLTVDENGLVTGIASGYTGIFAVTIGSEIVAEYKITVCDEASSSVEENTIVEPTVIDSGSCGNDVIWSLSSDGVLSISRPANITETCTGAMNGYLLDSPPWYKYRNSIVEIDIGHGVTSIGYNVFMGCKNVVSVSIPSSVTSIGYSAFEGCSSLQEVVIPGNVTNIDQFTFKDCSALERVVLPESLEKISNRAFYLCTKLAEINIPSSVTQIGSYAFAGCRALREIVIPDGVTKIEDYAFKTCTSLMSVVIPDGVLTIGEEAFCNCIALSTVTIPESITSIGECAFSNCNALSKVNISDLSAWCQIVFMDYYSNPLYYGAGLYINDQLVTNLVIPAGVVSIKDYAFTGCGEIVSVDIPTSVTKIGKRAFYSCVGLAMVAIPEGTTEIGSQAFQSCENLISVCIPNSVTSIGGNAFYGCKQIASVYIDDIVSWCTISFAEDYSNPLYYGASLYLNDEVVSELVIPENSTNIKQYAFVNCSSLTSAILPQSITSVGTMAFSGCSNLKKVQISNLAAWCEIDFDSNPLCNGADLYVGSTKITELKIPSGVTVIKNKAFYNCQGIISLEMPESITEIGELAFYNCANLTSIRVPGSVKSIGEKAFYGCSKISSLELEEGTTEIRANAFYNCSSLTTVSIPSSMAFIREDAFRNCSDIDVVNIDDVGAWCEIEFENSYSNPLYYATILNLETPITELVIPTNVSEISAYAFYNFRGLTSLKITPEVKTVGSYAFAGCSNLIYLEIAPGVKTIGSYAFTECSKLSSVIIPEGIDEITDYTFRKCSKLESISIPASVTKIGRGAFYSCSKLIDVFYVGNAEDWANIEIGTSNDPLNNATIHCSYGKGPYNISIRTVPEGCSVQVFDKDGNNASTAYSGQVMTVICTDSGEYELDYLTVADAEDLMPIACDEGQAFTFTMPDCDVEVSAVYKEKLVDYAYEISFNKNAKSAKGTMKTITGILVDGGNLPANTFTYSQKTFVGWNTKADGSGISYDDCESLANIVVQDNTNLTLYAQWRDIRYTLEFRADGITVGSVELGYNEKYKLEDFNTHKQGYHVGSWKNASNKKNYSLGTTVSKLASKEGSVVVFNANWAADTYKIAYNGNGNTAVKIKNLSITHNKKFTLASGSYKYTYEGCQYEFKGWSTEPHVPSLDYTYDYVKGQAFSAAACAELTKTWTHGSTKTLYAVWGPVEYKITYKNLPSNATNSNPSMYNTVQGLNLFADLDAPGYEFTGWYSDSKFKKPITGIPSGQTGTKTVYAKVSPISYKITYDLNGGTNSKKNPTSYNITQKKTLYNPTRTGYTFVGWYLENTKLSSLKANTFYGGDIVLTARWNPIAYTIKYYANGGTFAAGTATTQRVAYDDAAMLLDRSTISKDGYTLTGWNTKSTCDGKSYWISTSNLSAKSGATVKLYAMWEYPVVLHGNYDGASDHELSLYYNQSRKLTNEGYSRQGYTFKGWATSAANAAKGTVKYSNNKSVKNLTPGTELWAAWTANSVKITFNKNDGSKSPAKKTQTLKTGANLPDTLFSRTDLRIVEWNTKKDGSGTAYKPNEPVANIAKKSSSSLTLYAIWAPEKEYKISFNANGGSGNMGAVYLDKEETLPSCSYNAPSGKRFMGWKINGNGPLVFDGATLNTVLERTDDKEFTLYAQWQHILTVPAYYNDDPTFDGVQGGCRVCSMAMCLVAMECENASLEYVNSLGGGQAYLPSTETIERTFNVDIERRTFSSTGVDRESEMVSILKTLEYPIVYINFDTSKAVSHAIVAYLNKDGQLRFNDPGSIWGDGSHHGEAVTIEKLESYYFHNETDSAKRWDSFANMWIITKIE